MTREHDPLQEPLRLLREASLPAGFEERLAQRLGQSQQFGNAPVIPLRSRKRLLLMVAAIAIPAAAAAAATKLYVQRQTTPATHRGVEQPAAQSLTHLGKPRFTAELKVTVPAVPAMTPRERLLAPRLQEPLRPSNSAPNTEERGSNPARDPRVPPASTTPAAPRIEAIDPFESKSSSSKPSSSDPKAPGVRENLRSSTERGAARVDGERSRDPQRELRGSDQRGNDSAQQARERVQARERKGQ